MIVYLLVIACAAWVYFDARSLGVRKGLVSGIGNMSPVGWLIATLGIWIVAFPAYFYYRGAFKKAAAEPASVAGATAPHPNQLSGWSITAFYAGLLSILAVPAPIALFSGILALRDIHRDPNKAGKGRAIFGIVAGMIFTAFWALTILSARNHSHGSILE